MRRLIGNVGSVVLLTFLGAQICRASTELPSMFDARSVALGGAGAAFAHNPTAAFFNPAALEGIDTLSVTVGISPYWPKSIVPLEGPNTEKQSDSPVSPLFFGGVAYRLPFLDRLVTGLAVYPTAGLGGVFKDVQAMGGEDIELAIWMIETTVPVSLRIVDGLSVAVGWRFTYLMQGNKAFVPPPVSTVMDQEMSGVDAAGFSAGVFFRPFDWFQLGLSYRSKLSMDMDGTTEMTGQKYDTVSEFKTPHGLRLGAALWLLEKKLMIALDLKYLMYSESNQDLSVTIKDTPMGDLVTDLSLDWEDVIAGHFGVEYLVHPMVPVRLGYSLSTSATPKETANYFTTAPGLLHSVHAGAGLRWDHWSVDLAAFYTFNSDDKVTGALTNLGDGNYQLRGFMAALSGSFHF